MKQSYKVSLVEDADKWGCKITSLSDFIAHHQEFKAYKMGFFFSLALLWVLLMVVW